MRCWKVRIHLWSTLLSPHSHPLKITVPLVCDRGPLPPPAPAAALEQQHRILHLISTKAHHIFNFCFKLFLRLSSSKAIYLRYSAALRRPLTTKSLPSTSSSCPCVFSVHFFGSVFPLADLCLGAAKIKRAFWCRPGCLRKCRNAVQTSTP